MNTLTDAGQARLETYLEDLGDLLGDSRRKSSFAIYANGLLTEGDRKSVEPIAARATGQADKTEAMHQKLLHFVSDSRWNDLAIRRASTRFALKQMTASEPILATVIDDTGFLKQGKHSVGVQRQYTGSAGKVTNCQLGVSLCLVSNSGQLPIDFSLYLPESWANDAALREKAHVPKEVVFQTKPELALAMLRKAQSDGLPLGVVLGDAGYGNSSDFRLALHRMQLPYSVGVASTTKVFEVGNVVNRGGHAISLRKLAFKFRKKGKFERFTWREGTKGDMTASFAMRRVTPCAEQGRELDERPPVWLLIEWRDGQPEPDNYYLSSLPPDSSLLQLVSVTTQRWRTERAYQDLKGELGLDHFEGRSFRGWHHHISVVLACYAFAVAERHRIFPLTTRRPGRPRPHRHAA